MKKKTVWLLAAFVFLLIVAVGVVLYNCRALGKRENTDKIDNADKAEKSNNAKDEKISIWILGDSLAAFSRDSNSAGWGEGLEAYLKNDDAVVRNAAMGGASSGSFSESDSYQMAMDNLKKGDYVIVQFGINDAWYEDLYTDPIGDSNTPGSFKYILKEKYIRPIVERGGHVILSTSVMEAASMFYRGEEQNEVFYSLHVQAVRELAEDCRAEGIDVVMLDAFALTQELYREIGMNEAYKFHVDDGVHYNNYGAYYIAGLIAEELKNLNIPCFQDIRTIEEVMANEGL